MARLIPVIHYASPEQVMRNASLAAQAGCFGVFLIDMSGSGASLAPSGARVRASFPDLWLGVNRLDLEAAASIDEASSDGIFDGVWADNPGLHSVCPDPHRLAAVHGALERAREANPDFRFYGSVDFKTQSHEPHPESVVTSARGLGWIPTISGPATGVAAAPSRVTRLSSVLASSCSSAGIEYSLALASGVTPDNASLFPGVTDFLVATGISLSFHDFDGALLSRLQEVVSSLPPFSLPQTHRK